MVTKLSDILTHLGVSVHKVPPMHPRKQTCPQPASQYNSGPVTLGGQ